MKTININNVSIDRCNGKSRVSKYFGQVRKMSARMSRITYDEENKALLIRDELKTPRYDCIESKELFTSLLDCFGAIPEVKVGIETYYFLGSLYFYLDMETFKVSSIYVDATDTFYEVDGRVFFDDKAYASWKEEFIKIVIKDLKNKYEKRQKELLKEMKNYENTKC